MSYNLFINGAAGYIGGSVLAALLAAKTGPLKDLKITAAVRREEQVAALTKLGVNVILLDLYDEEAINKAIVENEIDIVVHTTTSSDTGIVSSLARSLSNSRKIAGREKLFVHSSVTTTFAPEAGWPHGTARDSDPTLFEKEKALADVHPVRKTNVTLIELAKELGFTSVVIPIPHVYGVGKGEWRKISVNIPANIRASINDKVVRYFDVDSSPPTIHIDDLSALYATVIEKFLQGASIPSGEQGYYFGTAHQSPWKEVLQGIAKSLYARGLVTKPTLQWWSSDDEAADSLGFPRRFARAMMTASHKVGADNGRKLGWEPKWTQEMYLNSLDDEVQATLDFDMKPTIFDDLLAQQKA